MNRKLEELIITDENLHEVFAVGLVDMPAIEVNWMKFSKEEPTHKFSIDKVKRIVTGPLAIPNLEIFRNNGTEEDKYVFFSEETIARLAEKFMRFSHQNTITHNHIFNIAGNTVIESWLIEDTEIDKSYKLGYRNLPKGTWMISVKVQDEKYWNEFIESGILKGFSLECNLDNKPVEMKKTKNKKQIKISMKKLLEFLKNLNFNSETSTEDEIVQLEAAMFQLSFMDGERTLDIDDMFIATYLDDSSFPTEGEHLVKSLDLTADYKLLVGAEGKVLAIITSYGIESEGEMSEEVATTEEVTTEMSDESKNEIESLKIENKNLMSKIAELSSTITKMSKEKSKPIEVKNIVDKSQKVDNSTTSLSEILKNRKK